MEKKRKKYRWIDIGEDARRQYIDAQSVFRACEDARREKLEIRGSMRWKHQSGMDYLIRVSTSGNQKSLGPRSDHTEKIYQKFIANKEEVEQRLSDLTQELE